MKNKDTQKNRLFVAGRQGGKQNRIMRELMIYKILKENDSKEKP